MEGEKGLAMVARVYPTTCQGKHVHLNVRGQIEPPPPPNEQGVHLLNLGLQTPRISNGGDEATKRNEGLG